MILAMAAADAPILVVDDDPKIAALVRTYLERERFTVITAGDGQAALRAIEQQMPRLVVLDLMLPGIDGIAVIRRARELGDVPIIVLSARGSTGDRVLGITRRRRRLSAKALLACRIGRARPGRIAPDREARPGPVPTKCSCLATCASTARGHRAEVRGRDVALSALELRLLWTLLDGDGRALSRDQLLDAIHGSGEGDVLDRAIDVYVKRLREKLDDDPAEPRYVATVRGLGYRAAGPVTRIEKSSP